MILVRDIFYLKFGKAKEAKTLLKGAEDLYKKYGIKKSRALTDLVTGHSYTLILESEWLSLADWENTSKQGLGDKEWQKWYSELIPLVNSAGREILNIVS